MLSLDRFLDIVKDHQVHVLLARGVYRHLVCAAPGTGIHRFEIMTFPGHLAYVGDLGSYTFCRLHDMFEFFRTGVRGPSPQDLGINPGYWGEKVEAYDRLGGLEVLDEDALRSVLEDYLETWADTHDVPATVVEDVREQLLDEVWSAHADGVEAVLRAAAAFESRLDGLEGAEHIPPLELVDFWDRRIMGASDRFLLCLYAIVWTIQRYDAAEVTDSTPG